MFGPSPLSPASRGVGDIEDRAERIADYERRFPPVRINFKASVDEDLWSAYWDAHRRLVEEMRRCEDLATTVRAEISSQVESLRDRRVDSGH